jgi:hypothetical protein
LGEDTLKLFELVGVKSLADKKMDDLLRDITGSGSKFSKIGDGHYAQVLSHQNGTVYKFWAKDSAYETFVDFVEKNSSNLHLPKFKSGIKTLTTFFDVPEGFPKKIKYIKMEKLEPISHGTRFPGPGSFLYLTDVIDAIVFSIENGESDDQLIAQLSEDNERDLEKPVVDHILSLHETIKKLLKYPGMKKFNNDFHSGNLMFRGTGTNKTIVITDPVSGDEDYKFNKQLMQVLHDYSKRGGKTLGSTKT